MTDQCVCVCMIGRLIVKLVPRTTCPSWQTSCRLLSVQSSRTVISPRTKYATSLSLISSHQSTRRLHAHTKFSYRKQIARPLSRQRFSSMSCRLQQQLSVPSLLICYNCCSVSRYGISETRHVARVWLT